MDDEFDVDDDFLAALAAADAGPSRPAGQQPPPQKVQQPTPQRLDRPPPPNPSTSASAPKIVQPTPQALPTRSSGSSILVSPRQKGNPVLACLRSIPWEYSDILADYGLGLTTCALFLSLKYHRLHPEYIYARIRNLQGKYNLRVLLTMVDIPNHEDSLRELAKTSLVNNVTVILCWSAAEAARYLELYKSYEHANFSAIRGQQATGYAEKLVEFVTVPRAINKADAVALVSTFGSLRHAVNADPEQVSIVGGWGERKVKAWCKAVDQPFRAKKAAKRTAKRPAAVPLREMAGREAGKATQPVAGGQDEFGDDDFGDDDFDDILKEAAVEGSGSGTHPKQPTPQTLPPPKQPTPQTLPPPQKQAAPQTSPATSRPSQPEQLSGGIAAALARLRDGG